MFCYLCTLDDGNETSSMSSCKRHINKKVLGGDSLCDIGVRTGVVGGRCLERLLGTTAGTCVSEYRGG